MTDKKSLFAELIERRIPQILGVYVASVWLAVEMADWMSERFEVPTQFSSYVFVIMIAFLPLVGLLAWGHGRPGKDKWTQKQIIFIPFNIAIAWFAVNTFIRPEVQATEIMSLADEQTGQMIEYEVAKSGLSQKVDGFFWENDTGDDSLDWLSYGAMWMVAKDLMRNPIISIRTPYESVSMLSALTSKGFNRAIGEPLSLNLDISADRDSQWFIKGRIFNDGGKVAFEASLYDVISGTLVTQITSTYDDWLFALDDLADQLGRVILKKANIKLDANVIPDVAISQYFSSDLAAIKLVMSSLNSVNLDNNFEQGVAELNEALSIDEKLAEAYVLLINYYRGLGDFQAAKKAAESALKLEYNLTQESLLKVKANYYGVSGENDKAIKVLENWVKLYPNSADALQALGANYIRMGHRLDDALATYQKLSELQEVSSSALVNQAKIYRLKEDQDNAIKALQAFLTLNPGKAAPHIEMANTYLQFGDIEMAKMHYEEASLISINDINADLGLAKIMSLQGQVEQSLNALDELIEKAETNQQKVRILVEKENILFLSGRLREAMELVETTRALSQSYMSPLEQDLTYDTKKVGYLIYLQQYDEAWQKFALLRERSKPPFDKILHLVAHNLYQVQGEYDLAFVELAEFEQFLKEFQLVTYDQFVYSANAIKLRLAGEFDQALALHDKAINDSKQSFLTLQSYQIVDELMYQKAITLTAAGEYQAALDLLNDNIKRNPINTMSYMQKIKVLIALDETNQAASVIDELKAIWVNADEDYKELPNLAELEASLKPS